MCVSLLLRGLGPGTIPSLPIPPVLVLSVALLQQGPLLVVFLGLDLLVLGIVLGSLASPCGRIFDGSTAHWRCEGRLRVCVGEMVY